MGERSFSVSGSGYVFVTTSKFALFRCPADMHRMPPTHLKCRREDNLRSLRGVTIAHCVPKVLYCISMVALNLLSLRKFAWAFITTPIFQRERSDVSA